MFLRLSCKRPLRTCVHIWVAACSSRCDAVLGALVPRRMGQNGKSPATASTGDVSPDSLANAFFERACTWLAACSSRCEAASPAFSPDHSGSTPSSERSSHDAWARTEKARLLRQRVMFLQTLLQTPSSNVRVHGLLRVRPDARQQALCFLRIIAARRRPRSARPTTRGPERKKPGYCANGRCFSRLSCKRLLRTCVYMACCVFVPMRGSKPSAFCGS